MSIGEIKMAVEQNPGPNQMTPADEARHPQGPEDLWGESWYMDFAAMDASYGGYVRLGLYPNLDRTWLWVHLTGEDRPLVLIRDHDLLCPDGEGALSPSHEGQPNGVSASIKVEEEFKRFRVQAQGTGVRLADPADAFHGEEGEAVSVSVDLTWESRGPVFPYAMTTRYEITCHITGTITIDGEVTVVDCPGQRDHSWGVRDWWQFPWNWTAGHFDDGTSMHAARSIIPNLELFATGYTISPDGEFREAQADEIVVADVVVDDETLPISSRQRIGDVEFTSTPVGHAPVLLIAPDGRVARFPRAMCRYETADGRKGTGWTEYNWPEGWPGYLYR